MALTTEDIALISAVLAFVASEVLPRIQSVEGNSISEVVLGLLGSRCIRRTPPLSHETPATAQI